MSEYLGRPVTVADFIDSGDRVAARSVAEMNPVVYRRAEQPRRATPAVGSIPFAREAKVGGGQ